MSGDVPIARAMVFLGFIAAFAILLYGNGGPSMPFAPSFPVLQNPFGSQTFFSDFVTDGTDAPTNVRGNSPEQAGYCDHQESPGTSDWFGCVNSPDAAGSYVTFGQLDPDFQVVLGTITTAGSYLVTSVDVSIQCHGNGDAAYVDIGGFLSTANGPFPGACETGGDTNTNDGYKFVNITLETLQAGLHVTDFSGATVQVYPVPPTEGSPNDLLTVSYVRITIHASPDAGCGSGDTVCQIAAIGLLLVRFGQLGIAIVLWVLGWLAYAAQLIGNFVAVIAWCYAIPGMPTFIQFFVDAYLTGVLAILTLKLV